MRGSPSFSPFLIAVVLSYPFIGCSSASAWGNPGERVSNSTGDLGGAGGDSSSGEGGASGMCSGEDCCKSAKVCENAHDLGVIRGDGAKDIVSAKGYTSEWLTVYTLESDSRITVGVPMRVGINLVSPPDANFDLYVYLNPFYVSPTLVRERVCMAPILESTNPAGQADTALFKWGECCNCLLPNTIEDSRAIMVEVRHVSGDCNPNAQWTLTIEGNEISQGIKSLNPDDCKISPLCLRSPNSCD